MGKTEGLVAAGSSDDFVGRFHRIELFLTTTNRHAESQKAFP